MQARATAVKLEGVAGHEDVIPHLVGSGHSSDGASPGSLPSRSTSSAATACRAVRRSRPRNCVLMPSVWRSWVPFRWCWNACRRRSPPKCDTRARHPHHRHWCRCGYVRPGARAERPARPRRGLPAALCGGGATATVMMTSLDGAECVCRRRRAGRALPGARGGAGMKVWNNLADWRAARATPELAGRTIGFVPTMGALHTGHRGAAGARRGPTTTSWS